MHLDRQADLTPWLPLAACAIASADRVGRKAQVLARSEEAGVRTPGGRVLPADAFWAMLEAHGVAACARYLGAAALALDPAHTREIAREISAALMAPSVDAIAAIHAEALFDHTTHNLIVCRSSAAMEDGPDAAFPGMFLSVLDIRSAAVLAQAIAACWRSVFAPDLIRYLLRMRPAHVDVSLALLVQPQIAGAWYGVCFAADAVGGRPMIAEITDAAPDALVGGAPAKLRFAFEGGRWWGESQPPRGLDELPPAVTTLVRLAGGPVDVEFALAREDGALIVLQARPLTRSHRTAVHAEPPGVRVRVAGQSCAGGRVGGIGGRDVALVDAITTADYARVLDARAIVAAAETSPLGHVSILCRELAVPLVAGVGAEGLALLEGEAVVVDGDAGLVLVTTDLPVIAEAVPDPHDDTEALIGIDELTLRLLLTDPACDSDDAVSAILRDRRRLLGATSIRIVGSEADVALTRLVDAETAVKPAQEAIVSVKRR